MQRAPRCPVVTASRTEHNANGCAAATHLPYAPPFGAQ